MGCGKSVLLSNIVAFLYREQGPDQVITHHFCEAEHAASLSARNILGTIARQLLKADIENTQGLPLQQLHSMSEDMDANDICDLLSSRLAKNKTYYMVIDGVDECAVEEVAEFARYIDDLRRLQGRKFHILVSGRLELEHHLFKNGGPTYRMSINPQSTQPDVTRYIDDKLKDCLQEGRIHLTNPATILKVANFLHQDYSDSFLFVRLFIEELCASTCEKDILVSLENPPQRIGDLLRQKMCRVRRQDHASRAVQILEYCGVTKRPLSIDEYSELLSFQILQPSLDPASIPRNMYQIISACCGLVYVDEEYDTVHYVHATVKQHFFAAEDTPSTDFDRQKVELRLGHLCLTYLNFDSFHRQLAKVPHRHVTPIDPVQIGLASVTKSTGFVNKAAQKLLTLRTQLSSPQDIKKPLEHILEDVLARQINQTDPLTSFVFLEYARDHWIDHVVDLVPEESPKLWRLFSGFVEGVSDFALRPWASARRLAANIYQADVQSCSQWAIEHTHDSLLLYLAITHVDKLPMDLIELILNHGIQKKNQLLIDCLIGHQRRIKEISQIGLILAAYRGRLSFLKSFIHITRELEDFNDSWRSLVLFLAAGEGHLEVVEHLLVTDYWTHTDFDVVDFKQQFRECDFQRFHDGFVARVFRVVDARGFNTALQAAAGGGHLEIIRLLLDKGAGINAKAGYQNGRTALQAAAGRGHLEIVRLLLDEGADINAKAGYENGRTALQAAAQGGYPEVLDTLIQKGADVHAAAGELGGVTALQAARIQSNREIEKHLRAAGAPRNKTGGDG